MKYNLIALDVDGTLLDDEHRIMPLTDRTLKILYKQGIRIVLCTGRGPVNTLPVMTELGMEGPLITHNGALTVEMRDRRILAMHSFAIEDIMPIVSYCRSHGFHYDVNSPFDLYLERVGESEQRMYSRFGIKPVRLANIEQLNEPLVKLTLFGDKEQMDLAEQDWQGIGQGLRLIRSGDRFIDIMNEKATKGRALKQLCELWDIPAAQVLAIGNYFNDLEMIEYAGLGIAMGNSPELVKKRADEVTDHNHSEGVHKALRKHCFTAGFSLEE